MTVSNADKERSIRSIIHYLVKQLSVDYNMTEDMALCDLIKTVTYTILLDKNSKLYAETPEYVYSLLLDEKRGDVISWLRL